MTGLSQRPEPRPGPRPLLGGGALVLLIAAAGIGLLVLLPLARQRLNKAQSSAPSSLSLNYLELSLSSHPEDAELRRTLVKKQIESGQLAKARETLQPLLASSATPDLPARLMLLDIDRALWASIPEDAKPKRAAAMAQVLEDVKVVETLDHSPQQQADIAQLYLQMNQPLMAAAVYDRLARAQLPDAEDRVRAADSAWLAAGMPQKSAELHAELAAKGGQQGFAHAKLAIERIQSAGDSDALLSMIERMRKLYPDKLELLELAVKISEGYSVARAFQLATELSKRAPDQAQYHRLVARLAEATGHQLRALDEYVWLVRHGGTEADRQHAISLAKANWDLPLLRELKAARGKGSSAVRTLFQRRSQLQRCQAPQSAGASAKRTRPSQPAATGAGLAAKERALRDELALDEALGDAEAVLRKLTRALSGELSESRVLWQRKLDLQRALGQREAALQTAQSMAQRFGNDQAAAERVAALQLELGNTRGALATLQSAQAPKKDASYWMRIASLAFEAGDLDSERSAYQQLIKLPGATQWQYQRLWELAPDRAAALQLALAAFERFESESMFYAALAIYRDDKNEAEELALLARGEQCAGVRSRPDYWQARIGLHQQRTARAVQAKDYPLAKRELDRAAILLERAQRRVRFEPETRAALERTQSAQLLSVGLGSADQTLIAAGYAAQQSRLSVRERVYVLQKLQRDEEALLLAKSSLARPGLSEDDRSSLTLDARTLSQGRAEYVRVNGDALHMDGLGMLSSAATVLYAGQASGLRGEASYTQLQALDTRTPVLERDARELSGALQGRYARVAVELGVRARDEQQLRPFGSAQLQLAGDLGSDNGTFLRAHVNTNATDTAQQRAWAARDALELQTAIPLGRRFYVSARGLAEAYYTRFTRDLVGTGLSLDAGAGMNFDLPAKLGAAGVRVTGRVAPRFSRSDAPATLSPGVGWLPQSSEWAGLGASIGRGKLDAPPLFGRDFCYVLDGAAGWLWPQQGVGFSAQAGFGFSLFGADLLTLAARGGNVVGSTVWGANLGYGISLDR